VCGKDDDICCSADKDHILEEISDGDELMRTRMKPKVFLAFMNSNAWETGDT